MKKINPLKRRLVINNKLQYTVLFHSIALAIWISVLNLIFRQMIFNGTQPMTKQALYIYIPLSFMVLIFVAVTSGLILTNRIAGPIYRLKQHLEDVAEGKSKDPIAIRKSDYFLEIFIPYNKVIGMLKELQIKNGDRKGR